VAGHELKTAHTAPATEEDVTSTILQIDGGIQATNLPFRLPDL
jgi:hypothetical protein